MEYTAGKAALTLSCKTHVHHSPVLHSRSRPILKLKYRKTSFVHNTHVNYSIVLRLSTEHGSITAVLCAKFQNDWITAI